jgi:transcription initiation factor TFIIIB Brf1 subunit/transcription initiation factor TFIIB
MTEVEEEVPVGRRHESVVAMAARRDAVTARASAAHMDQRLTVAEAAHEAAVSEHTIRRAYVYGHLRVSHFGMGRSKRIRRGDLFDWLDAGGKTAKPVPLKQAPSTARRRHRP